MIVFFVVLSSTSPVNGQDKIDSLFAGRDTTAVLDSLMKDFDLFLDSISKPHSFVSVSLGLGTGLFSYEDQHSLAFSNEKKLVFMPALGYYHKSGFGLGAAGFMVNDNANLNLYQFALTPSYDYVRRKLSTGISYSRYFTKDSLDFYTTPIQNEVFAYFSWKNWWLRPGISMAVGWGSRTSYDKREYQRYLRLLQRTRSYYVTVRNDESVRDYSVTLSLRKDFDWYDVFGSLDNLSITPVLLLNAGTQQFGFNTSYSTSRNALVRINSLPSNSDISDVSGFALQSVSGVIRLGYLKGMVMVQPQVYFDYALWDTEERFNVAYSVLLALAIN